MLGVGNTIGVGIYVLLGVGAKEAAGPSVVICFLAAILVTLVNALVYAEFASHVPQTGALYIYIYKVAGEFAGFLCGWMLFIGGIMGGSVGARAWSGMVDSFFNNSIQAYTVDHLGKLDFGLPFAESLDVVAFLFQLFIIIIVSCNVFCSSIVNTILGFLTTSVLVFVFVAGLTFGDSKNFLNADHGGFAPFGVSGIVKGASLALYATIGFEVIAVSSEEAKNPSRAVPRAIILELILVAAVYLGAAIGLLFLCPYWLLDLRAPLPSAFEYSGVIWGKYIVTIGPLFGITNLQMLGLYGASRIMYRMAVDGLFFSWFNKIEKKTGVPRNCVIFLGVLVAFFSLLFDLSYVVKVNVLLLLLGYIALGSALIKLKVTEALKVGERSTSVKQLKNLCDEDGGGRLPQEFYDHEMIIPDENQNSENSVDVNTSAPPSLRFDLANVTNSNDAARNAVVHNSNIGQGSFDVSNDFGPRNSSLNNLIDVGDSDSTMREMEDEITEYEMTPAASSLQEEEEDPPSLPAEDLGPAPNFASVSVGPTPEEIHLSSRHGSGLKQRMTTRVSMVVPGILSVNVLLLLHFVTCFALAAQINFGYEDLLAGHLVAVAGLTTLGVSLLTFSVLLGLLCGEARTSGFQTPLMPLIPTLAIIFSSVMLLSAGELMGLIEVSVLLAIGSVMYVIMILMSGDPQLMQGGDSSERRALFNDSEEADDEIDESDDDNL
ncbi:cationic amino acid transporter 4 [Aplysia californica]|uniref:Cationic amino acid transporter 4 n=1 Tax=Aplysia californica TaxID=6500 RepID=A0ABM1AAE5_APLCA|nr:cationic amino acid transporter 4 [Aplysia californica]